MLNYSRYFRQANEQLYAKPKRKKIDGAAALGKEFVWKEIKIKKNKIFSVFGFQIHRYQVLVGE